MVRPFIFGALFVIFSVALTAPALAADPDRPHPHTGIVTAWKGTPTLPALDDKDLAKLEKGEAVLKQEKQEGGGGRGVAVQDIEAPPEVVWSRITDYAKYPKMVDGVKECENYEESGDTIKTRFMISAMLMNIEYYIHHTYRPQEGYLTWTLDYDRDSDLDDSVGFWRVMPIPEKPGWTRVYYSVEVRLRGWVPGAVENMVAKSGLTKATAWVKAESQMQAGTDGILDE